MPILLTIHLVVTFGSAPSNPDYPLPEEAKNLVMYSRVIISGTDIMFSDTYPGKPFVAGNNISLAIVHHNLDEVKSYFEQLIADGKVRMELQETMWSKCYGSVVDKFGIEWQLTYAGDESGK